MDLFERAWLLYRQSKYQLAIDTLKSQLLQNPSDAHCHALWALCLLRQKNIFGAEAKAHEAVSYAPEAGFVLYAHAWVLTETANHFAALERTKRIGKANQVINNALRMDPTNADYHCLVAKCKIIEKDLVAAKQALAKGLESDPENVDCMNLNSLVFLYEGNSEAAIQWARRAMKLEPENSECHTRLGCALVAQQDYEQALVHLREALRIHPNHDTARQTLVSILKSRSTGFRLLRRPNEWWGRQSDLIRNRFRWVGLCLILIGVAGGVLGGQWSFFAIIVALIFAAIVAWALASLISESIVLWTLRQDEDSSKFISVQERSEWDFCLVGVLWLVPVLLTWATSNLNLALAAGLNLGVIAAPLLAERLLTGRSLLNPRRVVLAWAGIIAVLCIVAAVVGIYSPTISKGILIGTSLLSATVVLFQFAMADN